jgi:hypothetical protein
LLIVISLILGFMFWRFWTKFAIKSVAKQQDQMRDLLLAVNPEAVLRKEAKEEAEEVWATRHHAKTAFQKLVYNSNAFKQDPPATLTDTDGYWASLNGFKVKD